MKLAWILSLMIITIIIKLNTAKTKDYSTESNIGLIVKTTNLTERRNKDAINKRKNFLVTFKPPINIRHSKHRRSRKKTLIPKSPDKHAINTNITRPNEPDLKSRLCKNNRNAIEIRIDENTIQHANNSGDDVKGSKGNCSDSKVKSIKANKKKRKVHFPKCCKLNHKCLAKYKCFGTQYLKKRIDHVDNQKFNRKLEEKNKIGSNEADSTTGIVSTPRNKISFIREDTYKSTSRLEKDQVTENSITGARIRRSVNIIVEEGIATTSSGYRSTDQDLSVHSNVIYRNIHN